MKKRKYKDVITRFLRQDERLISSNEHELPFVIEATKDNSHAFLMDFLSSYSSEILDHITTYGAVLLRGFNIASTAEFQAAVLSIQGMKGISNFFMPAPGRIHVDDLKFVFHTDSLFATGGTLYPGGFHNENYYSADVASYISFFCKTPSKLGGETGLVNMSKVYDELGVSVQKKLEKNVLYATKWSISEIAQRYKVSADQVKQICSNFGLILEDDFVILNKPSVIIDKTTQKKSFFANFAAALPDLMAAVLKNFENDYKGFRWMLHRVAWKSMNLYKLYRLLQLASLLYKPKQFFLLLNNLKRSNHYDKIHDAPKLSSVFTKEEVTILAKLIRSHFSSFLWHAGDILIIDNTQIAHGGMPGRSRIGNPRLIRAMLCNPLEISYAKSAMGIQIKKESTHDTLGEILHQSSIIQ